jgi:uncharacterized protein (DUF1778 family)
MRIAVANAKECRLNLRATKEQRTVIERGASMHGQNVTDFVVSSAYEKAERVLAEQRNFVVPPAQWDAFVAALDRPTVRHERLARLLTEPSLLER